MTASPQSLDGFTPMPADRVEAYREAGYWRDRPFHRVLDAAAARHPDRAVVVGPHGERSYAELAARSRRVAGHLALEWGVAPGERVALQLTNRVEFVELLFACSRVGAIPVALLPRHGPAEVRHVLERTDARAYVTDGAVDEAALEGVDHRLAVGEAGPDGWPGYAALVAGPASAAAERRLDAIDVDPCAPGVFVLSGGTTGMPKAIPRTHNDYVYEWEWVARAAGFEPTWTTLSCVPIGHNASLVVVLGATLWAGATMAVEPRLKPAPLAARIETAGVTYAFAVPTQLVDFGEPPDRAAFDLSSLEAIITGGAKASPELVRDAIERWDVAVLNNFGMAEGPTTFARPGDPVAVQAETVGRPINPDADDLRLVDPDTGRPVPDGEPGELVAKGPGVFTGYFRAPAANERAFDADGWLHTGDLLARRPDGNLVVHGRLDDTIIRGGESIYAPGVEDVIVEHPAVEQVAVVGLPDERLGQRACACVELRAGADGLTLEGLRAFLEERGLAVFKHPERLERFDRLPRTAVGKLDKATLRERLAD